MVGLASSGSGSSVDWVGWRVFGLVSYWVAFDPGVSGDWVPC